MQFLPGAASIPAAALSEKMGPDCYHSHMGAAPCIETSGLPCAHPCVPLSDFAIKMIQKKKVIIKNHQTTALTSTSELQLSSLGTIVQTLRPHKQYRNVSPLHYRNYAR